MQSWYTLITQSLKCRCSFYVLSCIKWLFHMVFLPKRRICVPRWLVAAYAAISKFFYTGGFSNIPSSCVTLNRKKKKVSLDNKKVKATYNSL